MTREELVTWATRNGWKPDRWGHLKREFDNGTHRLRLSRIAVRHEITTPWGWARIASAYYKNLAVTADGQLAGMNR